MKFARVTQLQDGDGGEHLGVGRHPEEAGGADWNLAFDIRIAEAACPHQVLIVDHADCDAGESTIRHLFVHPGVEQANAGRDVGICEQGRISGQSWGAEG